jgi:hypothetical protein
MTFTIKQIAKNFINKKGGCYVKDNKKVFEYFIIIYSGIIVGKLRYWQSLSKG